MSDTTFQRARKPAERTLRRSAILAAAAELFDAGGINGAGINAIASRAGFTKSNIYRYFESREDVLLSLLLDDFEAYVRDLETRAPKLQGNSVDAMAHLAADAIAVRPRLGRLLGVLASVLEENVSEATIAGLKRSIAEKLDRVGRVIGTCFPGTRHEDCVWVAGMVGALVAGLWPSRHPSPTVRRVLDYPEFAGFKPSIERDLERAVRALLQSVVARSPQPREPHALG